MSTYDLFANIFLRATVITIKNLQFQYPSSTQPSLTNINLHIAEGSLFGLLGPNGAGKTTLLSLLCGLQRCPTGHIFIEGQDISAPKTLAQARLALVPQEYAFYLPLTVAENLRFFAGVQGIGSANINACIARTSAMAGLTERLNHRAHTLSGGLKRRLNLAIGLLNQPNVLLLDEPTVGIDPHSRHFILQTIKSLNQQGVTVIYTSHYMEEIEALCDRIAIIDHGQVLLEGDLQTLLAAHGATVLRVECNSALPNQLLDEMPDLHIISRSERSLELHITTTDEILTLLNLLRDSEISRITYGNHSLESLFLNFTDKNLRD